MKRTLICFLSMSLVAPAFAEEAAPKPKSETTAWILAFDPVPGDALLYSGRTAQGVTNAVIGTVFLAGFIYGLADYLTEDTCVPSDADYPACLANIPDDNTKLAATIFMGTTYLSMLVWDGWGGVHYVRKHNRELTKSTSLWKTIRPSVAWTSDGALVSAAVRF